MHYIYNKSNNIFCILRRAHPYVTHNRKESQGTLSPFIWFRNLEPSAVGPGFLASLLFVPLFHLAPPFSFITWVETSLCVVNRQWPCCVWAAPARKAKSTSDHGLSWPYLHGLCFSIRLHIKAPKCKYHLGRISQWIIICHLESYTQLANQIGNRPARNQDPA